MYVFLKHQKLRENTEILKEDENRNNAGGKHIQKRTVTEVRKSPDPSLR